MPHLSQSVTLLTHEYSNNHLYTTSDKLYLASGEYSTDKIIYAGSVDKSEGYVAADEYTSIKLSWKNYREDKDNSDICRRSTYIQRQ